MSASVSANGIVSYAHKHWKSPKQYDDDCTNFASKSLNLGGGLAKKDGPFSKRGNDNYWWRSTSFGVTTQSYSWAGARHLANFISLHATSKWRRYISDAQPGDIIFYNWNIKGDSEPNGWNGISHAAVVTKVDSKGNVYITQHSKQRYDYPLKKQFATNPHTSVWIVKVKQNY